MSKHTRCFNFVFPFVPFEDQLILVTFTVLNKSMWCERDLAVTERFLLLLKPRLRPHLTALFAISRSATQPQLLPQPLF